MILGCSHPLLSQWNILRWADMVSHQRNLSELSAGHDKTERGSPVIRRKTRRENHSDAIGCNRNVAFDLFNLLRGRVMNPAIEFSGTRFADPRCVTQFINTL